MAANDIAPRLAGEAPGEIGTSAELQSPCPESVALELRMVVTPETPEGTPAGGGLLSPPPLTADTPWEWPQSLNPPSAECRLAGYRPLQAPFARL